MPNQISPTAKRGAFEVLLLFLVGYTAIADAEISTAFITAAFRLGFILLHSARSDLVISKEYLEQSPVQQFIAILGHQKRAIAILYRNLVV